MNSSITNVTCIITVYNEEENIESCIKSAHLLTKDIILIDTGSADKTVEMAKKMGVSIYNFPYSFYVEPSRSFGIKKAKGRWIFILDADERVTPELAAEVNQIIGITQHAYYKIPRKNIFAHKKWLRYGGWFPDFVIRLIKRSSFVDWPSQIHSTPQINGTVGILKNPLIHYFHPTLEHMVDKTIIFENLESELLFKSKKGVSVIIFFRKFFGELYRRFIRNIGFLDGSIGIIESLYQAHSKTITYIFLYEKYKKSSTL